MGLANELFSFWISQNETTLALSLNDYQFYIAVNSIRIVFTDTEIKADAEGRYMIDISPLGLGRQQAEVPKDVIEYRQKNRERKALENNSIRIRPDYKNPDAGKVYFYMARDKLRIYNRVNQKQVTVDTIEIKYGKKAVNVESLELGHHYLQLPPEVAGPFERILKEKELEN